MICIVSSETDTGAKLLESHLRIAPGQIRANSCINSTHPLTFTPRPLPPPPNTMSEHEFKNINDILRKRAIHL